MITRTLPLGTISIYKYVVVLSHYRGKILLSRHRRRTTWETQGGHIEQGETPMEAARRELYEESGATQYRMIPLCDYWAGEDEMHGAGGMVFAAQIDALGPLPQSEMAHVQAFDALPQALSYPEITPVLFDYLRAHPVPAGEQVLIGTTNASKVVYFKALLQGAPVSFVTPHDLGIHEEPQETGKTPLENAKIKAQFYGRYADVALCADSGLYIDALALDDPRQPGLHVRTPNGVRLGDEQMIEHYAALSRSLGGRSLAYYLDGTAMYVRGRLYGYQATREQAMAWAFYMLATPCAARREGWPLDSLSIDLEGRGFLDPAREHALPQQRAGYYDELRRFLLEKLGM